MSTASAARRAPAQRHRHSSATPRAGPLKDIERLTNQRIAVVPTPANEDMPAAPPQRPREEREARDDERPNNHHRGHWSTVVPAAVAAVHGGGGGGGRASSPVRRALALASPSAPGRAPVGRAATIADRPQGDRPATIVRAPSRRGRMPPTARRPAALNRPYTPRPQGDRPFGGPPRGGNRAAVAGRRRWLVAAAAAAARPTDDPFLAEDFETLAKQRAHSGRALLRSTRRPIRRSRAWS